MPTIYVTDEVKRMLLEYASKLQIMFGRRVDFNEAIRHLLLQQRKRDPKLLLEACKPIPGVEEALKELYEERRKDYERVKRRFGL
mgnify:CR=1 FL=1